MKSCSWLDPSHSSSLEINFSLSFDRLSQVENDCRHHNKAREIKEWRRDSSYYQPKDTLMGRNGGWSLMLGTQRETDVCLCVFQSVEEATCALSSCRRRGCAASRPVCKTRSPWQQGWYTTTCWLDRSCSLAGCGHGLRRLSVTSGSEDSYPVEISRCWWCPAKKDIQNVKLT